MAKLGVYLRQHTRESWGLLATAAGHEESLVRSARAVSRDELAKAHHGLAESPSSVWRRIEALAAYDPTMLIGLSRQWKRPPELSGDVYDLEADYFGMAWKASLRFLHKLGAIGPGEVESHLLYLQDEVRDVFGLRHCNEMSVRHILGQLEDDSITYSELRRLDGARLTESTISAEDVRRCGQHRFGCRILLGRASLLQPDATEALSSLLLHEWAAFRGGALLRDGFLSAMAVARDAHLPTGEWFADDLIGMLEEGRSPDELADVVFSLVGPNWFPP